ncbi:N-acetyltransferase [Piscinibacter aquaticus]|uniref:N-acetyltransferase n=1 Tax=Piscinibacter aquaticus TaxID=392597 RepID=A0A5C6TYB4_9BURK|nr:N-acetyltransferase [Piscinibacter aquaticus]
MHRHWPRSMRPACCSGPPRSNCVRPMPPRWSRGWRASPPPALAAGRRRRPVLGYCYASTFAEREAYRWSVTTTAYVRDGHHRRGIGRAMYAQLLEALRRQGAVRAFAGITLPNEGSVGLHRALGFEPVGLYPQAGFKLGRWWDVALVWPGAAPPRPR